VSEGARRGTGEEDDEDEEATSDEDARAVASPPPTSSRLRTCARKPPRKERGADDLTTSRHRCVSSARCSSTGRPSRGPATSESRAPATTGGRHGRAASTSRERGWGRGARGARPLFLCHPPSRAPPTSHLQLDPPRIQTPPTERSTFLARGEGLEGPRRRAPPLSSGPAPPPPRRRGAAARRAGKEQGRDP
jgi:hypothetical protein